jgi:FtsH-binding integral membrane protein
MVEVGTTMALAQSARPIEGAVATLGVSDRVAFLRKTYAHLCVAIGAFALLTAGLMKYATATSYKFSEWAVSYERWHWGVVLGVFMGVGYVSEKLARSNASRGVQYVGLFVAVASWAVIFQPMIWILISVFNASYDPAHPSVNGQAATILTEAVVITLAVFAGLTLFVMVTKKDFSFMGGTLAILSFGALGLIASSLMFGFNLGAVFSVGMILLMAGYILYQTSLVLAYFPPTGYVAASLMLFSTLATLFWYVLRLLMELNRR